MSIGHGPKIISDGLIFAYDMTPSSWDSPVSKSWKGRPTTNIVTNTNLDTGWSKGYCTSIQWDDYPPPPGVDSQVVSFIDADSNGSGYWYSYGDYAPQGDGVTYYTSVWARTVGSDWTIRPYTANNSESGRIWLNTMTVPGDGEWYRLEFNAITTTNPNDSDSLSFNFPSIPANQRCWLCAPQMTTGGHSQFVEGTRSNTQAILDWTGNHTITANSLVYNSDNSFSFNGSNTYMYNSVPSQFLTAENTTDRTWEVWVKPASVQTNAGLFGHKVGAGCSYYCNGGIYINSTQYSANWYDNASYRWLGSGVAPVANTWAHVVVTWDSADVKFRIYVNGALEATSSATNNNYSSGNVVYDIGFNSKSQFGGGGASDHFNGDIGVARYYYNKTLTADEVAQNFKAMRGRFGL